MSHSIVTPQESIGHGADRKDDAQLIADICYVGLQSPHSYIIFFPLPD